MVSLLYVTAISPEQGSLKVGSEPSLLNPVIAIVYILLT